MRFRCNFSDQFTVIHKCTFVTLSLSLEVISPQSKQKKIDMHAILLRFPRLFCRLRVSSMQTEENLSEKRYFFVRPARPAAWLPAWAPW